MKINKFIIALLFVFGSAMAQCEWSELVKLVSGEVTIDVHNSIDGIRQIEGLNPGQMEYILKDTVFKSISDNLSLHAGDIRVVVLKKIGLMKKNDYPGVEFFRKIAETKSKRKIFIGYNQFVKEVYEDVFIQQPVDVESVFKIPVKNVLNDCTSRVEQNMKNLEMNSHLRIYRNQNAYIKRLIQGQLDDLDMPKVVKVIF